MAPRHSGCHHGAPSPVKAGTSTTPWLSSTWAARASTSADWRMMPSPSRSHCTTAPATKMEPSSAYSTRSPICQAMVVTSLLVDWMGSLPVFIRMKQPVP